MKKYREFDEVVKDTEIPSSLYEFDRLMKVKPNWDKSIEAKKVYEREEYIVLKVKSKNKIGFIVYNRKKEWSSGHSHLNSLSMAEIVIKNVIGRRKPKSNNFYILKSHMRISDDKNYIEFIENLIDTKKNKGKKIYINRR